MGDCRGIRQIRNEPLGMSRVYGVYYPFPGHYCLFDANQHHTLSNAQTNVGRDNARLADWSFTCQQNVPRAWLASTIPLEPTRAIRIARSVKDQSAFLDVRGTHDQILSIVNNRGCLVGCIDNLLDNVT